MIFDEIWRKELKCRKLAKSYDKEIRKFHEAKDYESEQQLEAEASTEIQYCEAEIQLAASRALARDARRLNVPLPVYSDAAMWEKVLGEFYALTPQGYADLRTAIRQERKERREVWMAWIKDVVVPIGGIVISILSLMIAYAALKIGTAKEQARSSHPTEHSLTQATQTSGVPTASPLTKQGEDRKKPPKSR